MKKTVASFLIGLVVGVVLILASVILVEMTSEETLVEVFDSVQLVDFNSFQVGRVVLIRGSMLSPPDGWVLCNGSVIDASRVFERPDVRDGTIQLPNLSDLFIARGPFGSTALISGAVGMSYMLIPGSGPIVPVTAIMKVR